MKDLQTYRYIIVGAGLAGVSAADGIREIDGKSSVLLLGGETHLPYDRPPLTKKLWFGKKLEEIFLHDAGYYDEKRITLVLGKRVVSLDPAAHIVMDDAGEAYRYEKLLLATGGEPRTLTIEGGELPGIHYFRTLDDYSRLREEAVPGKSALVIGGGFIGAELAAALTVNNVKVTLMLRDRYLMQRLFPEALGIAVQDEYIRRGVLPITEDEPLSIEKFSGRFLVRTKKGKELDADLLVVGIGIRPAARLALAAGLAVEDGIVVNEFLQTSQDDIYAAGDNALFPYKVLDVRTRIEHWDHAGTQGRQAGRNMAGISEPYRHMPYFFSDLFDFGFEAVGEIDSHLRTTAQWELENERGTVRYFRNGRLRGVMMCGLWGAVEAAREEIRRGGAVLVRP